MAPYANKLEALHDYRDTLLRVRNEGLDFDMVTWTDPCGTVACVAGWHGIFAADCVGTIKATHLIVHAGSVWATEVAETWGLSWDNYRQKVYDILFAEAPAPASMRRFLETFSYA